MNTNTDRESAKIYQFPTRSRRAVAGRESSGAVVESIFQRVSEAAFGDCWYHEAAVGQSADWTKR